MKHPNHTVKIFNHLRLKMLLFTAKIETKKETNQKQIIDTLFS